jgi:hypothetical protein
MSKDSKTTVESVATGPKERTMAQATKQAANPIYEGWLAEHPDEKLYTKPNYRRGFLTGVKDQQSGSPYQGTMTLPYCYGYKDGWEQSREASDDPQENGYWASLSDSERESIRQQSR